MKDYSDWALWWKAFHLSYKRWD